MIINADRNTSTSFNSWSQLMFNDNHSWSVDNLPVDLYLRDQLLTLSPAGIFSNTFFSTKYNIIDSCLGLSNLDIVLFSTIDKPSLSHKLLRSIVTDDLVRFHTLYFSRTKIYYSEFQDSSSIINMLSPETTRAIFDFFSVFIDTADYYIGISSETEHYTEITLFDVINKVAMFSVIFVNTLAALIFICSSLGLDLEKTLSPVFVRLNSYINSTSKETKLQQEVLLKVTLFFVMYYLVSLMSFDDVIEEVTEIVAVSLFYLFCYILLYLLTKYTIHYFSFLEASSSEGRSVKWVLSQFLKDLSGTLALVLRCYILLFRLNVYDLLDDFFDSYYIFVGDFDDTELFNEVFLSVYSNLNFTSDNQDDRSLLLEEEVESPNDLSHIYFLMWGKLFWFVFFMTEEALRLSLSNAKLLKN